MTYDQWKCTDPRENEPEDEDQPTELDLAYERICELLAKLSDHEDMREINKARILALESVLKDCWRYLEDHYDVVDGGHGAPAPNKAMRLGQAIEKLLGPRF